MQLNIVTSASDLNTRLDMALRFHALQKFLA